MSGRNHVRPDRKIILIALWVAYSILWVGGVGGHLLYGGTPANAAWTAPAFLLTAGLIVLASTPLDARALCTAAAVGFCSELLGVHSGIPFGHYIYTRALQPLIFGVPVVLLFAWMVLIAFVRQMRWKALASAGCMVAIDLVVDPVASQTLGYWHWLDGGIYYGIPAMNFAGWFVVSAAIFAAIPGVAPPDRSVRLAGLSVILFFAIVGFAHGLYGAGGIGLLVFGWMARGNPAVRPLPPGINENK